MDNATFLCFVCLCTKNKKKAKNVFGKAADKELIQQISYGIPELKLERTNAMYICGICHLDLKIVCKFKRKCIDNYSRWKVISKQKNFNQQGDKTDECAKETKDGKNTKDSNFESIFIKVEPEIKMEFCETENLDEHIQKAREIENKQMNSIPEITIKTECTSDTEMNEISREIPTKKENLVFNLKSKLSDLLGKNTSSDIPQTIKSTNPDQTKECSDNSSTIETKESAIDINLSEDDDDEELNEHFSSDSENTIKKQKITFRGKEKQVYPCTMCYKKYVKANSLRLHMQKHKKIKCPLCNQCFSQMINVQRHIRCVHEQIKDFACTLCDKKYYSKESLEGHINMHNNIAFACEICKKEFHHNRLLASHLRVHKKNKEC